MRCRQVEKRLVDYTDDLLDVRERERVAAHLAACEACRAAAEDVRVASEGLRGLTTVRPPATFAPRIRSTVRDRAPRALAPSLLRPDVRAALNGAFAVVVLGLLTTHYLAQPRPYVAPSPSLAVAVARVAPATLSAPAGPAVRRPTGQEPRPTPRPARVPEPRLGTDRSLSGIRGPLPSREGLAPKPADPPTAAGTPTVAVRLAALPDRGTDPRLSDEAVGTAPRPLALPAADRPSASGPTPTVVLLTDGGARPDSPQAGSSPLSTGPTDADASFGFDELFSESSLPGYADVS